MPIPSRRFRSTRAAIIAALTALLCAPVLLFAHAKLLRSSPASDAALDAAPTAISLWFSEKPELKFSSIELADSLGAPISLGAITAIDVMGISAPIATPLAAGRYTIAWKTAAADGHGTSGKLAFQVKGAVLPPAATITIQPGKRSRSAALDANAVVQTDNEVSISSATRWLELVGLLVLVGIVIFRLAVLPAAQWTGDALSDVDDRLRRLANGTLVLLLVSMLMRAFVQADLLPYQSSRMESLKIVVRDTQWGHGWAVGAIGAVVLLVGLAFARRGVAGWAVAAVGLIAVALGLSLTGHSVASPHVALAVAADVSHMLAAGGWLGGLAALMMAGLPSVKRLAHKASSDHGSRLLKSFHSSATECVVLVVATALVSSWLRLGAFDALWKTPYGNMLLRKVFFVAVALALGLYHARRIVPATWSDDVVARFKRSAFAELIIGLVIVGFTALLISMPLPR